MVECFSRIVSDSAESARMESPRVSSLDVMKCFAAFCVVWIHFGNEWLNPIVRCAVPIFFLIVIEVIVYHKLFEDTGDREMFVFTLPLVLPYFYWALYHPKFGERSFWAIIGRKYSAYIYIFHVLADQFLLHVVNRKDSLLAEVIYPFLVFGLSLCMAWLLVRFLQRFNIRF